MRAGRREWFVGDARAEGIDSGLASLIVVATVLGVAVRPEQVLHEHSIPGKALDADALVRIARWLGLKNRAVVSSWDRSSRVAFPAIAERREGGFFIIGRRADDSALVQDPVQGAPRVLAKEEFLERWSGRLILVTRRATLQAPWRKFDFSWFIPAILKYRKVLGEVILASFALQLFALISPVFFQVVIDKVLVHRGLSTLDVLCLGLLVVSGFEVVLTVLRTYVLAHTTNRIDVRLGADLFRHLLRLPVAYFEARRVGDTVARVRELENIRSFLTSSALTLGIDVFFTVVFLAVLLLYSPLLTVIVAGSLPLYVVLAVLVTPVLRARLDERFNRSAEAQAFLVESVSGIETLKASAVEPQHARRWEELLAASVAASFRTVTLGNLASNTAGFIQKATTVLILWFGARLVIEGRLTVGELVAFNMIAGRVSSPILRLAQLWQDFQQAGVSVRRLGDILNAVAEPAHNPGRTTLPELQGRVTFDHVSFRYRPDRPDVLNDLSFDIEPGQVVGIVGPSGSGKSTLAKLIQRLHVPHQGRVLVDGQDLAIVDPAWLRQNVGVVLQENRLFNRSVRENIALRDPSLPVEHVTRAAQLAGAHEFILELPEGYDTIVGEHGATLSGGQRQRIALARALVTNPRILILDEATSALDYESEAIIQANMRVISKGRTVFIIAHRLTAVRHADVIFVIDHGRLTEQGTHRELLDGAGQYARLYSHQADGVSVVTPIGS
ncbi:MAG: type I secretion system permease/ATPase [Gammaproteobacteria bacterium]|nr:type I secretion system permease/ATPase [Gammaproteobacteria bacterium]